MAHSFHPNFFWNFCGKSCGPQISICGPQILPYFKFPRGKLIVLLVSSWFSLCLRLLISDSRLSEAKLFRGHFNNCKCFNSHYILNLLMLKHLSFFKKLYNSVKKYWKKLFQCIIILIFILYWFYKFILCYTFVISEFYG